MVTGWARLLVQQLVSVTFGIAGRRRQTEHDPSVPQPGGEGAAGHLLRHPQRARQTPHPQLTDRRVQSLLLQNEGKLDRPKSNIKKM